MLKIRRLLHSEIGRVKHFPPKEWDFDLPKFLSFHFYKPYFYAIVVEIDNRIVGIGNGIINGRVGWLANIIVLPGFRKQGIGYEITRHLVDYFKSKNCTTQLLIATKLGENVYKKLKFKISSTYTFYRSERAFDNQQNQNIRIIKQGDLEPIFALDKKISGETRRHLIERFVAKGWVYDSRSKGSIDGFYLPDLGNGLILSKNSRAGLALLRYKLGLGNTSTVVPSKNKDATGFFRKNGFEKYLKIPRMVLGEEVNWKPESVFSRAAGYCG